ncbi:phage tail tape measure protein [Cupriavidus sp. D384]|uniref:phage tail tape measure protein n=1 Tax=Cupriavidus sp. D384 TaxID=1538095 RepID=UPI000834E07D|nr:phage tail tape measure protein [Cupriavidus sp. D384]
MSTPRNLRLEVVLQAVDKMTRPFKAIMGGSTELARTVKAAKDQIKSLEASQKQLADFRELKRGLKDSSLAMRNANDHAASLRARLDKLDAPMRTKSQLASQLKSARAAYNANIATIQALQRAGAHSSEAYRKLTTEQLAARKEVVRLTAAHKAAASQVSVTSTQYRALQREVSDATNKAQRLRGAHADNIRKLRDMRGGLTAAGIKTKDLGQHQRDLADRLAGANQRLRQQEALLRAVGDRQRALAAAQTKYRNSMAMRNTVLNAGASTAAAGGIVLAPVAKTVKDYVTFEDAMLGIARQVPGARDEHGKLTKVYHDMAREIRQLGKDLSIPTARIAEMVTAGARMEVPREELIAYTRTVAMMATAFDAVPDEIAESMGKVAKNFRIPTGAIMGLADTINYLDDNAISKGNDIINVLNRTSGVVSTVAMSANDAAALASTLLTLGERTETAGTAINAITQKFAAAAKGTKRFQSAVAEIGLSSEAIQKGMGTDAMGTIFSVIEAIQRLPKDKRIGVMVELAGMEHSDTLAKLVDKPDELRRQLDLANGAKAKGSMSREFAARQDTVSARWQRLQNQLFNTSSAGGEALRSTLVGLMDTVGRLIDRFDAFTQAHPQLVSWLLKGAAAVGALLTVLGALTLALAAALGPLVIVRYGMSMLGIQLGGGVAIVTRLAGAFNFLMKIFWIVGRALMLNPIGLAVTAIALGAYLLIKHWEPIKTFFLGLWRAVTEACEGGVGSVAAIILNWSPVGLFYKAFAAVMSWFGFDMPAKFSDFGRMMMQGLVDGITGAIGWVKGAIGGVADKTVAWFKDKLGIRSPSRVFAALGGFTMQGLEQGLARSQSGPLGVISRVATAMAGVGAGLAIGTGQATASVRFDTRPPIAAPTRAATAAPPAAAAPVVIHIHPPAGADEQLIARLVAERIERLEGQRAARARSRLTDRD